MRSIFFNISKNYAIELSGLHFIRKFSDGITFIEFNTNLDLFEGDHNPHFRILLLVFNFKIFEFEIYNVNHARVMER
jgi:hypothetical protein